MIKFFSVIIVGIALDPSRGMAYNEKADKRSWEHMKIFFAEMFN